MALSLAEADKYSTNQVHVGVAELTLDANPLLALMPFEPIRGNALQYQRELVIGSASFYSPGDTWTEATPTSTQITAALKIMGGDADIDKFLALTRSKDQDVVAEVLALKAKGFADTFGDKAIYGSIDTDPEEFDGLHEMINDDATGQRILASADATPDPGTLSNLDQLIDLVRPRPTALLMSRRSRRGIQALMRSQGHDLALNTLQNFNRPVQFYNDVPIIICDFLTDTETLTAGGLFSAKTGSTGSTIFAVRLDTQGLFGISADDPAATNDLERIFQLETIGTLETKDATRWRIKAYLALVLKEIQALGAYVGISSAAWTN